VGGLETIITHISEKHHVGIVRRRIAQFAKEFGFLDTQLSEISIVVTELAENAINHGVIEGKIICSSFEEARRKGIQIVYEDKGPGIAKIDIVMEDGYTTSGSLGMGLGAIRRLMSEFKISSSASINQPGTTIVTKKYLPLKEDLTEVPRKEMLFGVFSRSKLDELYNGDSYFLKHFNGKTIAAVIDGLGHGKGGFKAATEARLYFFENHNKPLETIVNELHERLKKTRGAVISIALIDDINGELKYVGIGNISTRVFNSPTPIRPYNYNGTLGYAIRNFKVSKYPWVKGNVIIMTSDGISGDYDPEKYPGLFKQHPIKIASTILKEHGRDYDDATILVGG